MKVYDPTNREMIFEVFYDRAWLGTQVICHDYLDSPYPHANDFGFPNRWNVESLTDVSRFLLGTFVHPTFAISESDYYRSMDGRKANRSDETNE